jgi:hypothetical protein
MQTAHIKSEPRETTAVIIQLSVRHNHNEGCMGRNYDQMHTVLMVSGGNMGNYICNKRKNYMRTGLIAKHTSRLLYYGIRHYSQQCVFCE